MSEIVTTSNEPTEEITEETKPIEIVETEEVKKEVKETATEEDSESEESESEITEESETLEPDTEQQPKKSSFKKRVDRLKQREALALEEANYWKQQALKGKSEPQTEKVEVKTESQNNGPDEDDFDNYEDYQNAIIQHRVDEALNLRESKQAESRAEQEQKQKVESFQKSMNVFREKTADFDDVLALADEEGLQISNEASEFLNNSELAPELLYTLCKDIDLLEKVNGLKGYAVAKELLKVELSLEKQKLNKKEIQTTKAPRPLTRAKGNGKVEKTIYESATMTQKEYEALRRKKSA